MMKNKRFDIGYDYKLRRFIRDKETDETLNILDSCHLLNTLYEENEQLKHDATVLIQANQDYRRENEQLKGEVAHYKLILMFLEEEAKRISSIRGL